MGMWEKLAAGTSAASADRRVLLEKRAASESAINEALAALKARRQAVGLAASPSLPGTFEMLYQSNDGRLCLFQTDDGHISAVDSSRMV